MSIDSATYKVIVLYLLSHASGALSTSQIVEYVMNQLEVNYFQLQQTMGELVEAGLIRQETYTSRSLYTITEEGRRTIPYFEQDLPEMLKKRLRDYLSEAGLLDAHRLFMPAEYVRAEDGYMLHLTILEGKKVVLEIRMAAPSLEAARKMCENWPLRGQEIYGQLMSGLL